MKQELQFYTPDCPVEHHFAPGVYLRQITMPAGSVIVGHMHKTEHINNIVSGSALVALNGIPSLIQGPCAFNSLAYTRKVLLVLEDMVWQTVHPIDGDGSCLTPENQLMLVSDIEEDIIEKDLHWVALQNDQIQKDFATLKVKEIK
jgi:hypothetical protein